MKPNFGHMGIHGVAREPRFCRRHLSRSNGSQALWEAVKRGMVTGTSTLHTPGPSRKPDRRRRFAVHLALTGKTRNRQVFLKLLAIRNSLVLVLVSDGGQVRVAFAGQQGIQLQDQVFQLLQLVARVEHQGGSLENNKSLPITQNSPCGIIIVTNPGKKPLQGPCLLFHSMFFVS